MNNDPDHHDSANQHHAQDGDHDDDNMLEGAPQGSDHGEESNLDDDDIVYVEDDEMAELEAMADAEEAEALANMQDVNDFETFQESEFGEGDEYSDGQVL